MNNKIGIIGGGQLGRMLSLAAKPLGYEVYILDPKENCPAAQVSDHHILGDFKDAETVLKFSSLVDFLTYEIEAVNLEALTEDIKIYPSSKSLSLIKDKFQQKQLFFGNGLPVSTFKELHSRQDIEDFAAEYGYPFLLKAKLNAYDGRGNAVIRADSEIDEALNKLGTLSDGDDFTNLYAESFVKFKQELAVVAARDIHGNFSLYPVVETKQTHNICDYVLAPAILSEEIVAEIKLITEKIAKLLDYVGVFAVEFFLDENNKVLINEIAPRVHNSGHYSIEACAVSQFEQHIRVVVGLPLGETKLNSPAAMVNILAQQEAELNISGRDQLLAISNVHLHLYGKDRCKPERKMGHITVLDEDLNVALAKAKEANDRITMC